MDQRRFILFMLCAVLVIFANIGVQMWWMKNHPPPPPVAQKEDVKGKAENKPEKADENRPAGNGAKENDNGAEVQPAVAAAEEPEPPQQWFTLGSASAKDDSPYRLLATLTSQGAAVERIELSSARYRDMEVRSGHLGHLATEDVPQGAKVHVVGPGTPADEAGLKPDDIITQFDGKKIADSQALDRALAATRPGQQIQLTVARGDQTQTLSVTLDRRPLEVVRPEFIPPGTQIPQSVPSDNSQDHDPYSFLLTLWQVDSDNLEKLVEKQKLTHEAAVEAELSGVKLRNAHWKGEQKDADTVEFSRDLPKLGLRIIKRFRIATTNDKEAASPFQLTLEVELQAIGTEKRRVAYQLDGPTGLPIEGWWFSRATIRETALMLQGKPAITYSPMQLNKGNLDPPFRTEEDTALLAYAGVSAQYFACAMVPQPFEAGPDRGPWLAQIKGILVGKMPTDTAYQTLGNISCRLVSKVETLDPSKSDKSHFSHKYIVFAGPKRPELLAKYGNETSNLSELVSFGWSIFGTVARLMTQLLHIFYAIVGNYGIAIIMLTVLVRMCMFPVSRKQALGAQKMQELKPEMDRINEKFKNKPEEKTRAMQELWRKHNYNPLAGCLPLFLQLPIFIGLYRALSIDVELRQAPLFGSWISWCSNLAAPDMLANWRDWFFMPGFLTAYKGYLSLGPYLNILPLFAVGLMIWQQKMFMPPATDDTTRTQQKMMKYMMVFMGYMFYTVPSGLCIYFIASSLWGLSEKKFLPKAKPKQGAAVTAVAARVSASADGNGAAARREQRKQRGKK